MYLVYLFGGWKVEYPAPVYFVYLLQGQIHSVFGVFASVHLCISHLGSGAYLMTMAFNMHAGVARFRTRTL